MTCRCGYRTLFSFRMKILGSK